MSEWIPARDLDMYGKNMPRYWIWTPPDRSGEVEFNDGSWLKINKKIDVNSLSKNTSYRAYLVYKLKQGWRELKQAKASVRFVKDNIDGFVDEGLTVFLDPDVNKKEVKACEQVPHRREDGWNEIKLGDFLTESADEGEVEMLLFETNRNKRKSGLIVKGIEVRPRLREWIPARDLDMYGKNMPRYWIWTPPDRSGEVEFNDGSWLKINKKIDVDSLRKNTSYRAYLVYKLKKGWRELKQAKASVRFVKDNIDGFVDEGLTVFLDPDVDKKEVKACEQVPHRREDGWNEIKLGDFLTESGDEGEVEMLLFETNRNKRKSGLIVKGIEVRPRLSEWIPVRIPARDLDMYCKNMPRYWIWSPPDRSGEVEFNDGSWLKINKKIDVNSLRKNTSYRAYLVYKLKKGWRELKQAKASVRFVKDNVDGFVDEGLTVFLDPDVDKKEVKAYEQVPHRREDGWNEIKLGDFLNESGDEGEVEMLLFETNHNKRKSGLIVKGIEVRPVK